uniref:Ig-like domain-containing protein n=1 Tax=Anser brachyrhynchus TaxID=132585 RepID=A0A8B9BPU2_9AVES
SHKFGVCWEFIVPADVVLPCHLSPQQDAHSLEVRWIRNRLSETVHHYHNGEDLYEEQMGAYAERTELARDGLSAGSLDLQISRVRPSDDGLYICTVGDTDAYDKAIVELEVSGYADPHLSLGGYEAGGVRVLCRSAGWYPLPQLLWRDARRQHLPSVSQTHSQDQEGLFEIEGAIIVTGSVEGPLSLGLAFLPAAPFFHNAQPWMVALALVLVILATLPQGQSYSQRVIVARKWAKVMEVGHSLVLSAARQGAVRDLSLGRAPLEKNPWGPLAPWETSLSDGAPLGLQPPQPHQPCQGPPDFPRHSAPPPAGLR